MAPPLLAPSLLAANHARLADGLALSEKAGAKWLHIDIMDGHFVPNLTFGPQLVADLRPQSSLFFDTHLMLDNPQEHIEAFIEAGSDQVSIHVEPDYDISDTLKRIRSLGAKAGIVLNPQTPVEAVTPYLQQVDIVLAMTVQPGFGGQSFQESVLEKTKRLAAIRSRQNLCFRIQVDGGVNLETADRCIAAGVDTLVAGTAFFKADDPAAFLEKIESKAAS